MTIDAIDEDYVTIAGAAALLRVSTSSIRRWIDDGTLIAYRLGRRRVLLRRKDLSRALRPTAPGPNPPAEDEVREPVSAAERARILALVADARLRLAEMLERRGGRGFRSSGDVLNELRDERTAELTE